jgi:glucose-1-phosphate adenylyltransferase
MNSLENPPQVLQEELPTPPLEDATLPPVDMNRVAVLILGGGQGTRLFPLTVTRCKPAICFGGIYRLIDIPISNAINCRCNKLFIITQFLSSSLHQHIFQTYRYDIFSSGFIELLPAEEKPSRKEWFQGTADAVRQNIEYFIETPVDYFLILSGDQLYNMNFQSMVRMAQKTQADLIVATLPVNKSDAKRMGLLKVSSDHSITDFCEKPQEDEVLKQYESATGNTKEEKPYLGSMGIYLFKREALLNILKNDKRDDFGKHLIPAMVQQGKTKAYIYDGYWEDIGTIESFYNANMALTRQKPLFDCYDEQRPIFSHRTNLPGPKIFDTQVKNSIICQGAVVEADEITHSILGPRTVVKKGTIIRDSYIMGSEFYKPPIQTDRLPKEIGIGENCLIKKCIIDKHVSIGNNVQLVNKQNRTTYDGDNVFIRDGIIVVPRGTTIPDGFVL